MLKILILSLGLASPLTSQAAEVCNDIPSCLKEGLRQERTRLPDFIREKGQVCNSLYLQREERSAYEACQSEIIRISNKTLTCESDVQRLTEAEKYDKNLLKDNIKEYGESAVPEQVQKVFDHLVTVAKVNYPLKMKSPVFNLRAYGSDIHNAHAGASGEIMITQAFWKKETPYTLDDIAAVLAHEISHVLTRDSLRLGCLATEWVESDLPLTIEEATTISREDFSLQMPYGKTWSALSQSIEFAADVGGKKLLIQAGYPADTMYKALNKLLTKNASGTAGSHPNSDVRLQNLLKN